jgi:ribulose-phosphate 3-epimerase
MMIKISPSIMCANLLDLKNELQALDKGGADQFHVDIMDGHFVPNFCLNPSVITSIKQVSAIPVDVHLMVDNPDTHIKSFADAGADIIIPHLEVLMHPIRTLTNIRRLGKKAGVSVNPATDINTIPYLLDSLDVICVMTVDPGFAGQKMISGVLDKIVRLRKMLDSCDKKIDIMVDGQVMEDTAPLLVKAGANVLVMGSSGLFNHPRNEFAQVISRFKHFGEETTTEWKAGVLN